MALDRQLSSFGCPLAEQALSRSPARDTDPLGLVLAIVAEVVFLVGAFAVAFAGIQPRVILTETTLWVPKGFRHVAMPSEI